MKKYNKPEMDIVLFGCEDVITTSGGEEGEVFARKLKTKVNGNEGTDYGTQKVSIYD